MSLEIQGQNTTTPPLNSAYNQQWVADASLDKMEKLSSEKNAEEYHDHLGELAAQTNDAPVKDKMARLAEILAQKNMTI